MEIAVVAFSAALISALGTMVGFGGGIFMIPLLIVGFEVPIQFAVGMVSISLVPAAAIATYFNHKSKDIDYLTALCFEPPTIIGAILGAYLTSIVPIEKLEIFFAAFLIFSSWRAYPKENNKDHPFIMKLNTLRPYFHRKSENGDYTISLIPLTLFGGLAGTIAGMFGVGGGFLKTPIMVNIFKLPVKRAVGTSLLMILFTSLASSISHFRLGHIEWEMALPCIIGFSIGALAGNLLKKKVSDLTTKKMISLAMALAAMSVVIHIIQA